MTINNDTTFVGINHARMIDLELSTISASQLHRRSKMADEMLFNINKWIRSKNKTILNQSPREAVNQYVRETRYSDVMSMAIMKEVFIAVFNYYARKV